jgi:t-SNARE complex subunit (syntaxin)
MTDEDFKQTVLRKFDEQDNRLSTLISVVHDLTQLVLDIKNDVIEIKKNVSEIKEGVIPIHGKGWQRA